MAYAEIDVQDPSKVSPKVTASATAGGGLTVLALVLAAVLEAIPGEALAGLGPWALPVGAGIATLAAVAAAYAKRDPARDPVVVTETVVAPPVVDDLPAESDDLVLTEPVLDDPVDDSTDDPVAALRAQVGGV